MCNNADCQISALAGAVWLRMRRGLVVSFHTGIETGSRFSRILTGSTLSQAQGLTSSRGRRGHNSQSTNEEGKPSDLEDHCSLHFEVSFRLSSHVSTLSLLEPHDNSCRVYFTVSMCR